MRRGRFHSCRKIHGDEPEYTAYDEDHVFTFSQDGAGWVLADQRPLDPTGIPPVTEVVMDAGGDPGAVDPAAASPVRPSGKALPDDSKAVSSEPAGGIVPMAIPAGLNYSAMAAYAVKYWSSYNPAYRNFASNGSHGDCTNFISQIMREGGWTFVGGDQSGGGDRTNSNYWWYGYITQTYTWAGAENWSWFAPKRTTSLTNIWYMALADVLQLDFNKDGVMDHSMLVTKKTSSEIYMTYHTTNTLNRPLSELQALYANSAWWYSYRT